MKPIVPEVKPVEKIEPIAAPAPAPKDNSVIDNLMDMAFSVVEKTSPAPIVPYEEPEITVEEREMMIADEIALMKSYEPNIDLSRDENVMVELTERYGKDTGRNARELEKSKVIESLIEGSLKYTSPAD